MNRTTVMKVNYTHYQYRLKILTTICLRILWPQSPSDFLQHSGKQRTKPGNMVDDIRYHNIFTTFRGL